MAIMALDLSPEFLVLGHFCYAEWNHLSNFGRGFVFFVSLRPKSTAMVIAGRSVHLTTLFPGQA